MEEKGEIWNALESLQDYDWRLDRKVQSAEKRIAEIFEAMKSLQEDILEELDNIKEKLEELEERIEDMEDDYEEVCI